MSVLRGRGKVYDEVVGLLPAAGLASRISPLPCSKELYPVGFTTTEGGAGLRSKVACQYVLEKMRLAGVRKAFIVLRKGKWDIPNYFGDGEAEGMSLAYLIMRSPRGAPFTLDQARPFVKKSLVALGFPDIIFDTDDVFTRLLERRAEVNADVVLGLFPAHQPRKADMVDLHDDGRIRGIVIKPQETHLQYTWVVAVWTPVFTEFMHNYLTSLAHQSGEGERDRDPAREVFIGDVMQAAIGSGLNFTSVPFPEGSYTDIGTPDELLKAVAMGLERQSA